MRTTTRINRSVAAIAVAGMLAATGAGVSYAQTDDQNGTVTVPTTAPTLPGNAVQAAARTLPADALNVPFTDSAGTKSTYHLFTSKVKDGAAKGVVVYLDGDGMYGYKNPTSNWALGGSKGVPAEAGARGYATIAIKTPSSDGTFWTAGAKNAKYVAALIEKVRADLGVTTTWLISYSGGSQLASKYLIPGQSSTFAGGGGAVITGGGGQPSGNPAIDAALKTVFPMHWYTGTADNEDGYNGFEDSKRGQSWYAGKGFAATIENPAGLTHSGLGTKFGTILGAQLDKHPGGGATSSTTSPSSTTTSPSSTTTSPSSTTTTGNPSGYTDAEVKAMLDRINKALDAFSTSWDATRVTSTSPVTTVPATTTPTPTGTTSGTVTAPAGDVHDLAYSVMGSAENSSTEWRKQAGYIEYNVEGNPAENRGYTGGIVGFTSKTSDMLALVDGYVKDNPGTPLAPYVAALKTVNGTSSKAGLGASFEAAWKAAATDPSFLAAQVKEADSVYWTPAVEQAGTDGLGTLGKVIYFDAIVMHGPGDDPSSFGGIRDAAIRKAKTPAAGGDEKTYLGAFLDARKKAMLAEEGHSDTTRIDTAQRVWLDAGNLTLAGPLTWSVYGQTFTLNGSAGAPAAALEATSETPVRPTNDGARRDEEPTASDTSSGAPAE